MDLFFGYICIQYFHLGRYIVRWAATCDFQQCGILISADSDQPVHPPFKLRNSKWCSGSRLTFKEYSSDWQRLWSDCAYVQADLRLCWRHIPHCWKSHVVAHIYGQKFYFISRFLLYLTKMKILNMVTIMQFRICLLLFKTVILSWDVASHIELHVIKQIVTYIN